MPPRQLSLKPQQLHSPKHQSKHPLRTPTTTIAETPTETLTETPTSTPTPEETLDLATSKFAANILPSVDGGIVLTASQPYVEVGDAVTIMWEISEVTQKVESGWAMQITLPDGMEPTKEDAPYFSGNIGLFPIEEASGKVTVQVQSQSVDNYPVTFDLLRKNDTLYSNVLTLYPATRIGVAGGQVVAQSGRIQLNFPEKAFLEDFFVVVSSLQSAQRFDLGASDTNFVVQAFSEAGEYISGTNLPYQIVYQNFPILPTNSSKAQPFYRYDENAQKWSEIKSDVDISNDSLFVSTEQFGSFSFIETGPQDEELGFKIDADPGIYIPGKPIRLGWTINGFSKIKDDSLAEISIGLPNGVKPVLADLASSVDKDGQLVIPADKPHGVLILQIDPDPVLPLDFPVRFLVGDQIIYDSVVDVAGGQFQAEKMVNGTIEDTDNKVKLDISTESISKSLVFSVRNPSPHKLPGYSLTWNPIEILAVDTRSGENVTKFTEPITI